MLQKFLLICALMISLEGFSQWKSYIIGVKGDTLNCVDQKGRKQGRWVIHVDELRGERGYEEEGEFINDKKEGIWRRYTLQGDIQAIESYRWGNKHGRNVYYNHLGDPLREENWKAVNPDNPYDTVNVTDPNDPQKVIAKQVVKLEGTTLKHGTWKYYTPNGTIERTEKWVLDKPAVKAGEGDELAPIDVTAGNGGENAAAAGDDPDAAKAEAKKKLPKPQAVLDYEKKNSGKKKIRVRDGSTGGY
ncbi:hypothetical protein V9K67_16655 [Paraflavisolibacter sp. H34]|uniref:hypothetical protein n=1 Tax=Huijunlia imazamoxiresistens TaxID=3127457 RepID=UPI003019A3BC